MSIFVVTYLIDESDLHGKPLIAISVLTVEINFGFDVWPSERDGTLLAVGHLPCLPTAYTWAIFYSNCRFRSQMSAQQCLSMRGIESHAGRKLIHGLVNLWLMRPIAGPRYCIDSAEWTGNWPSSHRTPRLAPSLFIPNRALTSCSFVPKSLTFMSFYIASWFYHVYEERTNWCLYLAQKLPSCFNGSFSEAVHFIFSGCMVLVADIISLHLQA